MWNENPYFEEPQVKNGVRNPNRFNIEQHVFPRACIARFCNSNSKVQTNLLIRSKIQDLPPTSGWFCAKRVWDQRTEKQTAQTTETDYDRLASQLVNGTVNTLTVEMNVIVTRFYALWNTRFEVRKNPPPHTQLVGVLPGTPFSKDAQENLEMNGYVYALGSRIPSRMMAGMKVSLHAMQVARFWKGARWGILKSNDAEFLVPDNVAHVSLVPVSPNICLTMDEEDCHVNPLQVGRVNRLLVEFAERYYFARNLEKCPIHRRSIPR